MLRACWEEARPIVQVIFQVRFLTGFILAQVGFGVHLGLHAVAGALSWLCATWVVYLLNGISDVAADRHNGGSRPVARGDLSLDAAAHVCVGLAVVSLALAALVSVPMVFMVIAMLVLGWLYSMGANPKKSTLGGFVTVVVCGGLLTYLAGWQASGVPTPTLEFLVFATTMSLWMALAGNTKDLADVAGDRATGRRTLPVLLGDRGSRFAVAVLTGCLACAFLAVAWLVKPVLLPVAAVLALGALILISFLSRPLSSGTRARLRRPYRIFMATQYAVHLTLLVSLLQ